MTRLLHRRICPVHCQFLFFVELGSPVDPLEIRPCPLFHSQLTHNVQPKQCALDGLSRLSPWAPSLSTLSSEANPCQMFLWPLGHPPHSVIRSPPDYSPWLRTWTRLTLDELPMMSLLARLFALIKFNYPVAGGSWI